MEEKVLYGNLTVYRERGRYLRQLEQYEKAKASYDVAFSTHPADTRLLIGRSQTCSDAVQPQQAYDDAALALRLQPDNMAARSVQAVAMYTMTDFERSLVMNHRGYRQRRQPPYFFDGINQGIETIKDCIGTKLGQILFESFPLIRKLEAAQAYDPKPPKPKHVSRIPRQEKKQKLTQMQLRNLRVLSRVMAMKYLGALANDKFYLQDLLEHRALRSANAEGSRELRALAGEALRSLTERQEMLRAQRPYYSIKATEKGESKHQNQFKRNLLKNECESSIKTADRMIKQIENLPSPKPMNVLIALVERMQVFLDKKTPTTLPAKEYYIDRLYRAVGEGYLMQYRLSYRMSEESNRCRIAYLMGMPYGRPKSFDSVIASYPHKYADMNQTKDQLITNLEYCENATQRCWLYYELARLLCRLKNYPLAKYYGQQCQREAGELGSNTWWLNGCYVLMSVDMQQGNANEVRTLIEEARVHVKQCRNPELSLRFLEKCDEMMDQAPQDERKLVLKRERQILSVMNDEQRGDLAALLKRMGTLPPRRRFSVLPQERAERRESERTRRHQTGLTVVPGRERPLRAPPRSGVPGLQLFDC